MNRSMSLIDRRRFLGMSTLFCSLGVAGVAGCDSSDTVGTPTGPPVAGANRDRMEKKGKLLGAGKDKDADKK